MDPRRATREPGTASADRNFPGPGPATRRRRTSIVVVRDAQTLSGFVPAWEELAAAAMEPNVFYEHWMLLPALEAFGSGKDISVVLVLSHDLHSTDAPPKLAGLFPLERVRNFRNLKLSALSLWQHVHCYACTPLVRAETASECMIELFRWLQSGSANASLIELQCVCGDGPFHKKLVDLSNELGLLSRVTDIFTRGLWHKGDDMKGDPESGVSGDLRRRLRRKERRLCERGRVEHLLLRPEDDVARWIDEFMQIEASGWKGSGGTSLADSESGRSYFRQIATSAFHRGRLLMLGINFDGRPIARRCAFAAGEGSFAFKTAYDEKFADYSPGAMLELDNIRQLRALPAVRWMDSCASPDNLLVNRISNGRKTIQTLAVGGGALGDLVVSGLPLLRWTHRQIVKRKSAEMKEA
ncbi:MAG TPA: GNAT family N-acetyltransferase [Burkholderiales bacterium]|nr:GNAT family N-acetyltransferase [Burkholderiales bacterium]